ncbi:MAG: beta-glucosidase [Rhodoferax sp.]|nr:beta-glucosidase [Rhodoferax sp.]
MTPSPDSRRFPPDFQWGAATSAAQIEGAAHEDGKGPSIWDTFCAEPGRIKDGGNVDVACDHYHRFEHDVELMEWLGLNAYRFSISWPRVQPQGSGAWNDAGFAFYDRLIERLLRANIKPHITLYHWDLPQALQSAFGGWQSRQVASLFAEYAAEVARRFGDRVASIVTMNEPWCVATLGHETGQFAPGLKNRRIATQVSHHLLLAHGLATQAMRSQTSTQLGIVLNHTPAYPAEATEANRRAARLADGMDVRWYMDPLFRGCYPSDVLEHLGDDAPEIRAGDFAIIQAHLDFLGINFYTRNFISEESPSKQAPGALGFTDMGWEVFPLALTQHLVRITREYAPPPLFITENGMANADTLINERVADTPRVDYLRWHLEAVAKAIELGADVRGYFYWSLLDNFEWDSGYTKRFGMIHVDYPTQRRVLKDSAHWYRKFVREHAAVIQGA